MDVYYEAEQVSSDSAKITPCWKLGKQSGPLHTCQEVRFPWVLINWVARKLNDRVEFVEPKVLKGAELTEFLEEIDVHWKTEKPTSQLLPVLQLTDRHGAFANLTFDYGVFGKKDPQAEKGWENDLLETDFIKKIVGTSHYYCPMDKVAKSLTFLLEIGWTILDVKGRRVIRQKKVELEAAPTQDVITIKAKFHYDDHEMDLQDVSGAFNRREQFLELSPQTVGLVEFNQNWADLTEHVSEGKLKKNRFGLLLPLFEELKIPIPIKPEPIETPPVSFQGTLFSYQNEGLQWLKFLADGGFGGLLADEMGLGKTVQVLAFFSCCSLTRPSLIVVPTSLLFNWQREFEKFLPSLPVYRHEGKDRLTTREELGTKAIILTSYALLRIDAEILQSIDYQCVVLDEGQAIKNAESQTAGICFRLKADFRLVITGTPIENRIDDLHSLFQFISPDLLDKKMPLHLIKKKIRPFLLRRKKEQVALQLPPKLEQTVYVEMSDGERKIYEQWLQNARSKVTLDGTASKRMEILEAILRLRQLCDHPILVGEEESGSKFERLMADLQEVVEEKRKVLVYSQFTQMLGLIRKAVQEKGWNYVYLDGSTKDRETPVTRFQDDEDVSIFLISLKAGGVGLNLTAADYVFLYDPWWNEAVERQAIDRAHRLGKTGTVIARRYITALSIEEKIMKLKAHKNALSQHLLDSEFEQVSFDDLLELLN